MTAITSYYNELGYSISMHVDLMVHCGLWLTAANFLVADTGQVVTTPFAFPRPQEKMGKGSGYVVVAS